MGTLRLKKSFLFKFFDVLIAAFIDASVAPVALAGSFVSFGNVTDSFATHYHAQQIVSLKIDFLVVKLAQLGNSIHNSSGIPQLSTSEGIKWCQ